MLAFLHKGLAHSGNLQCYMTWQWFAIVAAVIWVAPFPGTLYITSSLLRLKNITTNQFVVSLCFPPIALYYATTNLECNHCKVDEVYCNLPSRCESQISVSCRNIAEMAVTVWVKVMDVEHISRDGESNPDFSTSFSFNRCTQILEAQQKTSIVRLLKSKVTSVKTTTTQLVLYIPV